MVEKHRFWKRRLIINIFKSGDIYIYICKSLLFSKKRLVISFLDWKELRLLNIEYNVYINRLFPHLLRNFCVPGTVWDAEGDISRQRHTPCPPEQISNRATQNPQGTTGREAVTRAITEACISMVEPRMNGRFLFQRGPDREGIWEETQITLPLTAALRQSQA